MMSNQFDERLEAIATRLQVDLDALLRQARDENADGWDGTQPVDFKFNDRLADRIAETGALVIDYMHGCDPQSKKSIAHRIHRALGYYR